MAGGDLTRLEGLGGVRACWLHEQDGRDGLVEAGVVPGPDAVVCRDDDR